MTRILFTTACGPLPTYAWNDSLTDGMSQRFTKGNDIFTVSGHIHCHSLHLIAQNIDSPSLVLEFPDFEDFEREVKRGYDYLGISFYPIETEMIADMCRRAKELSPGVKIVLGGYGAMALASMWSQDQLDSIADHVCVGEGVAFMRKLLGERVGEPIRQKLLPKCGSSLPWLDKHPKGDAGMLITGLGCPYGCDFCSTSHMFGARRVEMLSPERTFEELKRYWRCFPDVAVVMLIDEDQFAARTHLERLGGMIREDRELGLARLGFSTFGSVNSISKWDPDEIAMTGVSTVFIGVESMHAGEYYAKSKGDTRQVFSDLHGRGISTVGALMLGWDYHTRDKARDDLEFFITLEPTAQQISRLCPFPGTPFWREMKSIDRLDEFIWQDVHFYGGNLKHAHMEVPEIMDLIAEGYRRLYEHWGPSVMRQLKVSLNGFEYCRQSPHRCLNEDRAEYHRRRAFWHYPLLQACERYAGSGLARRRARELHNRYVANFGQPTSAQKLMARIITKAAGQQVKRSITDPPNNHPRVEPFKRYEYKAGVNGRPDDDSIPYRVNYPHRTIGFRVDRLRNRLALQTFDRVLKLLNAWDRVRGREVVNVEMGAGV